MSVGFLVGKLLQKGMEIHQEEKKRKDIEETEGIVDVQERFTHNESVNGEMSNVYDRLYNMAYMFIDSDTKNYADCLGYFAALDGMGPYKIAYRDEEHNSSIVVDAIHGYYDKTQNPIVIEGLEMGIQVMAQTSANIQTIQEFFDVFFYQIHLEETGKAKFVIDRNKIIDYFNETIPSYIDRILETNPNFPEWYKEKREYIKSKYNIEFFEYK